MEALKEALNDDAIVHIKDAVKRDGEYTKPYPLGYPVIDSTIKGGVRAGDFIVGTGISGHGKTSLLRNISVNMSKSRESSVWFSYEEMVENMYAKFKEMGVVDKSFKIFTPKQMTSGNLQWIQEKIKESIDKYNTKFVFIDHIEYLTPKKSIKTSDQLRMVLGDICRELKELAMSLEIVIFLISHVKKVQGRAIEMQDIGESGHIFKLADLVLGVQRHVTYEVRGGHKMEIFGTTSTLMVLKNRIGGERPIMDFYMDNDIIIPLGNSPIEKPEEKGEIEVVEEKVKEEKQKNLFGLKD